MPWAAVGCRCAGNFPGSAAQLRHDPCPDEATVHKFQMEGRQKCKDICRHKRTAAAWMANGADLRSEFDHVNLREHGSGGPRKIALIEEAAAMSVSGRFAGSPGFLAAKPLALSRADPPLIARPHIGA